MVCDPTQNSSQVVGGCGRVVTGPVGEGVGDSDRGADKASKVPLPAEVVSRTLAWYDWLGPLSGPGRIVIPACLVVRSLICTPGSRAVSWLVRVLVSRVFTCVGVSTGRLGSGAGEGMGLAEAVALARLP